MFHNWKKISYTKIFCSSMSSQTNVSVGDPFPIAKHNFFPKKKNYFLAFSIKLFANRQPCKRASVFELRERGGKLIKLNETARAKTRQPWALTTSIGHSVIRQTPSLSISKGANIRLLSVLAHMLCLFKVNMNPCASNLIKHLFT